ncbi:MAG: MarR family transcriptional regulator [Xanthomonadales bacterium]|nr:MarR family transcriptional regulator [Xanthomonadales bacterium]
MTLAQCLVLLDIDEHKKATMGQLAAHLRLDHSTLTRTVNGLVRKNLVERAGDENDRRIVWIRLSAEGENLCKEIHESNDAYAWQVLSHIPQSERANVIRCFEMLVQAYFDHESQDDSC